MFSVLYEPFIHMRWLGIRFPSVPATLSLHRAKMFHQRQRTVQDIAEQDRALRRGVWTVCPATTAAATITATTTATITATVSKAAAWASRSILQSFSRSVAAACDL